MRVDVDLHLASAAKLMQGDGAELLVPYASVLYATGLLPGAAGGAELADAQAGEVDHR